MKTSMSRTGNTMYLIPEGVKHGGGWRSVEDYDERVHLPTREGSSWEWHSDGERVVEYGEEPESVSDDELPSFMRNDHAPEPEQTAEPERVKGRKHSTEQWAEMKAEKVARAKDGKLQWQEALHFYPELRKHDLYHLLIIVADHADSRLPYGNAFPGRDYCAQVFGVDPSGISRRLGELERLGFLVKVRRGGSVSGLANEYQLSLPEWREES